ncbi:MAG: sugar kinase [Acidobacteria bacterium]|jgi:sugar/nucleoside kinase (ribokinase family)|nr:sugar kinase [Acidobacteriota bacterium]
MAEIVSMGVHILDVLGRHVLEVPPGQGIALIDEIRITAAGTSAGTSVDLAKLGCKVTAVGAVGNDEMGDILIGILNRHGVNTKYIVRKDGVQTSGTILPIRPNGERPALHVMGSNASFCFDDVPVDLIAKADFVHVGGFYLMPKFDGPDTVKTLKLAKSSGAITTMDILGVKQEKMAEKIAPCMPYLDYFMPNLEEAGMITGLSDPDEMCKYFLSAGAKNVILKMGERGSLILSSNGERIRVPAFKVKLVDTTGCGDAWSAGFIAGLSLNMSISKAAQLGSACGSLVASGLGSDAGIIDLATTLAFITATPTLPLMD